MKNIYKELAKFFTETKGTSSKSITINNSEIRNEDGMYCEIEYYVRRNKNEITFSKIYDVNRGNGTFTKILNIFEKVETRDIVIECIHNERLFPFLEKRGYTRYKDSMKLRR